MQQDENIPIANTLPKNNTALYEKAINRWV